MYNCDSISERCAFEGTWSMFDRSTFWSLVYSWVWFGFLHRFPVCMLGLVLVLFGVVPGTSMTKSHKSSAGKPSIRKPASNDMISDSVELCDTDVSFLHIQLIGTSVRCTELRLVLTWNLQDLLQNLHLETTPIDNVAPHCLHDDTGGNHFCNECRKLIVPIVCHMLESILWQIVQDCSLTTECQVDQFVPGTSSLRQSVKILLTSLQLIQFPLSSNGDHPRKDLKLCIFAPSFCSPIRNTVPRTLKFYARFVPSW